MSVSSHECSAYSSVSSAWIEIRPRQAELNDEFVASAVGQVAAPVPSALKIFVAIHFRERRSMADLRRSSRSEIVRRRDRFRRSRRVEGSPQHRSGSPVGSPTGSRAGVFAVAAVRVQPFRVHRYSRKSIDRPRCATRCRKKFDSGRLPWRETSSRTLSPPRAVRDPRSNRGMRRRARTVRVVRRRPLQCSAVKSVSRDVARVDRLGNPDVTASRAAA